MHPDQYRDDESQLNCRLRNCCNRESTYVDVVIAGSGVGSANLRNYCRIMLNEVDVTVAQAVWNG